MKQGMGEWRGVGHTGDEEDDGCPVLSCPGSRTGRGQRRGVGVRLAAAGPSRVSKGRTVPWAAPPEGTGVPWPGDPVHSAGPADQEASVQGAACGPVSPDRTLDRVCIRASLPKSLRSFGVGALGVPGSFPSLAGGRGLSPSWGPWSARSQPEGAQQPRPEALRSPGVAPLLHPSPLLGSPESLCDWALSSSCHLTICSRIHTRFMSLG